MNDLQIRAFVRQLIAEAKAKKAEKKDDKKPAKKADKKDDKKEPKTVKSSGKLMDLKKEVAYLKEMSSQIQATGLTEADQVTEVEFANLQKFVSELAKVKEASAALKAKLDEEIVATEAKIKAEKDKIKEMIGLVSEVEKEDKKADKKEDKKDDKKKSQSTKNNVDLHPGNMGDEMSAPRENKKSAVGKMKEALKTALKKEIKKGKGLEEGALDDQIAAAEKTVAQKKKETADAEKKVADLKSKEAGAEAQG